MMMWLPQVSLWIQSLRAKHSGEEGAESLEWLAMVIVLVGVMVALSKQLNNDLPSFLENYILWLIKSLPGH